ncbi:hypothetical protein DL771_007552 [Monosporascus sp. 5C6A]|nr:hypothetical protein DL771_007552 [Monosporascus sp. 5C6A]
MKVPLTHSRNHFGSKGTPLPLFRRFPDTNGTLGYTSGALNRARKRMGLRGEIEVRPTDLRAETLLWSRIRLVLREPFLEFWGAFIMVLLGDSVTAQTYLSNQQYGSWMNICLGWSCAYIFGIYVAGDSGAYLNPAVTLTNCLFRGLPLRRFPTYAAAQFLGTFCAHGLTYANYVSAIDNYEGPGIRTLPPNETTSARIFCTFPAPFVPRVSQFFSEYIANFTSMFCIFAMRDENGADLKGGGFFVLALFWLNFGLMSSLGWETGSPINPVRDITGRIWLSILGYKGAWSAFNYYSWIPIVVPFIATISGAAMYDLFIYTGESPINKPGLDVGYLLSTILGRHDRKGQDEEQGYVDQSPGSSGRTQGGDEGGRRSTGNKQVNQSRTGAGDEVTRKGKGYDQQDGGNEGSQARDNESEHYLQQETSMDTGYSYDYNDSNKNKAYDSYTGPT